MGALKLTVIKNGSEIQSWQAEPAGKSSVVLGRGEEADIKLEDRAVSRNHAVINVDAAGVITLQKQSEFGKLQLNGQDVSESALKPGDVINIADFAIKVESEGGAATQGTPEPVAAAEPLAPEALAEEHPVVAATLDSKTPPQGTNLSDGLPAADTPQLDVPVSDIPGSEISASEPFIETEKTAMVSTAHVAVKLIFKPGEANVEEFEIQKAEISIGRGSSCDVVIEDKKSSRKHAIIRKAGTSFFIKDLGSANGTYVNGIKISEQELAGEDVIKIGSTEFAFKAVNQEYFAQESQGGFLAVPEPTAPEADVSAIEGLPSIDMPAMDMPAVDPNAMAAFLPPDAGAVPGSAAGPVGSGASAIPGLDPMPAAAGKQSLLAKFRALPPRKQLIFGGAALAILFLLGEVGSEDPNANKNKAQQTQSKDPKMAEFLKLPKEKRQFIEQTYETAMDYYTKRNYEQAQYEAEKIKAILPNGYKDTLELIENAKRGQEILKAQAEEAAKKEAEEKRKALVMQLVGQAQAYFEKGMEAETKEVFNRILEIDPDNPTVAKLKAAIDEREQRRRLEEEQRRQIELMKASMQSLIDAALALQKEGKYYEAIDKYLEVPSAGSDSALLDEAKRGIESAREEIASKRQPHIDAAMSAYDSKDYARARDEFTECLKVDRKAKECKDGIARIRHDVHERSQKIYIEAIIAESVSDLTLAKRKYLECYQSSVPEDEYYGRCWRKFHRFTTLEQGEAAPLDHEGKPIRAPASVPQDTDPFTKELLEHL